MTINKFEFNGERYVKLDDLNKLLTDEAAHIKQMMREEPYRGEDSTRRLMMRTKHATIVRLHRTINMPENGEKYVIFSRMENGDFTYLVDVIGWNQLPEFMKPCMPHKDDGKLMVVSCTDIGKARLFDSAEDAAEYRRVYVDKTSNPKRWFSIQKWMFSTAENRDAVERLFYASETMDAGVKIPDSSEISENPKESEKDAIDRQYAQLKLAFDELKDTLRGLGTAYLKAIKDGDAE